MGLRLITVDRPGYGRSDARPGAMLLDWADDYVEFADQMGLPPTPVVGWSSGGRFALALGFRAPDLVPVIGIAAGRGPIDEVPGALDRLSPEDRVIFELLAHDRAAGLAAIGRDGAWLEGDGWETMFDGSWGDADDRVLAAPPALAMMKRSSREAARQGVAGFQADVAGALTPWGFAVSDVHQQVHLWWGESDINTDQFGLDYLAASIPHATLVTYPGEGHLLPISRWGDLLAALR